MNVSRSRSRRVVFATLSPLLLTTLGLGVASASTASAASAADSRGTGAWVRAAHLIPGLGPMDIGLTPFSGDTSSTPTTGVMPAPAVDGMRAITSAASYGKVTAYQQVPEGFYTITVRPAGASPTSAPMITGTLKAEAGQAFTVAGLGTKAAPRLEALSDDLTPPKAGETRVRLLPAASTAKTVTVTAENGPAVAENAAFGRPTGYAAVPAGTWTLKASGPGSTTATTKVDLSGGSVYTLLVLDSSTGLKVTPVVDASGVDVRPKGGAQTGGGWLATHSTQASHQRLLDLAGSALLAVGLLGLAFGASRRAEALRSRR